MKSCLASARAGMLGRLCGLVIVLAALALAPRNAAAEEEMLYPHAEQGSGLWGYIDKTGKIVIPLQFDSAQPFSEGLAAVQVHNRDSTLFQRHGFIDRTGAMVIPAEYMQVQPFRSGRAAVLFPLAQPNPMARWGLIDRDGRLILPAAYTTIGTFHDGRAIVTISDRFNNHKAGAIDLDGNVVVPIENDAMMAYSDGLSISRREAKFGVVDKTGAVVVPFQYTHARPYSSGLARVFKGPNGESGFVDETGALVIPFDYQMVHEFSEGYAVAIKKGGGHALIDTAGNVVELPQVRQVGFELPQPYEAYSFGALSEGLLPVRVSSSLQYGYMDREGALAIAPKFTSAYSFHDGVAVVKMNAEAGFGVQNAKGTFSGLIDRTGQFVAPPVFDRIQPRAGGLLQVVFGQRLGYIDTHGRPLTFQAKELDAYVAARREQLKADPVPRPGDPPKAALPRPEPGRALFAKAGQTEYYLRLPEGLCPLDDSQPADRTFIEDRRDEADKAFEARKARQPMTADIEQFLRKQNEETKRKTRYVLGCDQLEKLRAGGDRRRVESFITASSNQKDDRYDPSIGAGSVYAMALLCAGMGGADVFRWSDGREWDSTGTVGDAFKRLAAGQPIALRAKATELPACYTAWVRPRPESGTSKLESALFLVFGDWFVAVQSKREGVSSPDAFFREFERDRATIEAIAAANWR